MIKIAKTTGAVERERERERGCFKSPKNNIPPHTSSDGITIIALVITIVIMLILVTVAVTASINGGLFGFAKQAKDQTEIGEEKGVLNTSVITAMAKSRYGNTLQKEHLESSLNANLGEGKTVVIENEGVLVVKFTDSNRYYEVDSDGIISEPITIEEDKNAGDITKGETCDGTEEKPYLITCIEDLVEFSKMSENDNFSGKHVILTRTLNFNSIFSYNDYTTTEYGDLNTDGTVEDIRTELTKQGENCVGFTPVTSFNGTFDGQNNKICNLYENRGTNNAGLFALSGGTIKNLGLENITLTGATVGGILATSSNASILNCFVDGTSTVTGTSYIGLLVGDCANNRTITIEECYSKGTLNLNTTATFGGIIGYANGGTIKKCYNIMDISSMGNMGGIVGGARRRSNRRILSYRESKC